MESYATCYVTGAIGRFIRCRLPWLTDIICDMSKVTRPVFPRTQRRAEALGERLRLARLRRRISLTEMGARVDASRVTLARLERGELTVGLAVLVRVLGVLGLEDDLDALARDDELGKRLQDLELRRPRRRTARQPARGT